MKNLTLNKEVMEQLVMHILDKESNTLNLTYTQAKMRTNAIKINWKHNGQVLEEKHFLRCYNHIKRKVMNHSQYDGWDLTCQKLDNGGVKVLNEGTLFFNTVDPDHQVGYAFILYLESR